MAILQKIRSAKWFAVGFIGIVLILFILTVSNNDLNSGRSSEINLATIAGKTVSYQEFDERVNEKVDAYKERSGQLSAPQEVIDQIRDQVWNEYEQNLILVENAKKAGIDVSTEELVDMVQGPNPNPAIAQAELFKNPQTGQFDPSRVMQHINNLDKDETGEAKAQWLQFEQDLKKQQLSSKYFNLIKKGLYATTKQAKADFIAKNKRASITFAAKRYNAINDTAVTVTDQDLKKYYNEHKQEKRFAQEETTREIEYVRFDIAPTAEDSQDLKAKLSALKEKFEKTKDDTLFVVSNAYNRNNIDYYTKARISSALDSLVFGAPVSTVVGPVLDLSDNSYKIAKVLAAKTSPDSTKARHILIAVKKGQGLDTAATMVKADSLKNLLKQGLPFELLAKNSLDVESAKQGGDLGWFTEGKMVKTFNDACFNGKKGDVTTVISQYGVHIIEITDQTKPVSKVLLAIVDKPIDAGKVTRDQIFQQASSFSINNQGATFNEEGNKLGIAVASDIKEGDKLIRGIGDSRELVRWAYAAELNAVSEPFEIDNKQVVAKLSKIKEKGILPFELVKEEIEPDVIKEKKAEKIKEEINGLKDLNAIASKWISRIDTAPNITFSAFSVPGMGAEKKVLGTIFGLNKGEISHPIDGQFGVYVVKIEDVVDAPAADYNENKKFMLRNLVGKVDNDVFKALEKMADIEDNRAKFF